MLIHTEDEKEEGERIKLSNTLIEMHFLFFFTFIYEIP
jgi:hypothetical protein